MRDSGVVAVQSSSATLAPSFRIVEDGIAELDLVVLAAQRIVRGRDLADALAAMLDQTEPEPLVEGTARSRPR